MPQSCSYRRLYEGRGLRLGTATNGGSKDMMHELGISVRDKTVKDCDVDLDDFDLYVAEWPTRDID